MGSPKSIVLGLDGATLRLVQPWTSNGSLPNLARLMREGSFGTLHSTVPPTTPLAWPTIFTGCDPGKHGIFGFYKRNDGTYEWSKSSRLDLSRPAVWDILGAQGLRCGVFFVPFTFPAQAIDGVMVTGRGGASDANARIAHPTNLASELVARFGQLAVVGKRRSVDNVLSDVARDLEAAVRGKTEVIAHLVATEALDFVFAVWDHTDTVAHLFWHHNHLPVPDESSPVFRVYKAVDDGIGRVLDAAGGDPVVVVCSDHGTFPVRYRVRMAPWLEANGFLGIRDSQRDRLLRSAATASNNVPVGLRSVLPVRALRRLKRRFQPTVERAYDWRVTRIYPQPATAESLYVNTHGREPEGTVDPKDVDDVLAEVTDALLASDAPDGEKFVAGTKTGGQLYQGERRSRAPDLVVEPRMGYMLAPSRIGERNIFWTPPIPELDRDPPRSICYHDPEGMVIFKGPGVRAGIPIEGHCRDVLPTLLGLCGWAGPEDLDGRPLPVSQRDLAHPTIAMDAGTEDGTDSLTPEEEKQIEEQLKGLGYLE